MRQTVRPQMGMSIKENRRIGSGTDKGIKNLREITTLCTAGKELSVRVCARSSLSEAVVCIGIDYPVTVQSGDLRTPLLNTASPFQDNRTNRILKTLKSSEKPCRPGTHNDCMRRT